MHFLLAGLMAISLPMVIQVLIGLGIGIVTYTGADYAISTGQTWMNSQIGGLPADMSGILMLAGLDEGIKIIFAAWGAHIGIKVAMGAFTKFRIGQ